MVRTTEILVYWIEDAYLVVSTLIVLLVLRALQNVAYYPQQPMIPWCAVVSGKGPCVNQALQVFVENLKLNLKMSENLKKKKI